MIVKERRQENEVENEHERKCKTLTSVKKTWRNTWNEINGNCSKLGTL